ncbi:hypothetical protein EX30DRAFT_338957 [Ascodesmis nigricans]|uniref:Uncharacterized protein n=1 Tax=Ascodesmis nigricans TaxID=341454 RepID=A0A4S2N5S5_9PEZI|nr:hypothetical protein EX30DRAFT_338957 [Ascodesmis nigricans]
MAPSTLPIRHLYRHLLRELPPISQSRSSLHQQLREQFSQKSKPFDMAAGTQLLKYLQSQRMYVTLLERYNPGLAGEMDVAENVRLTARRVGLDVSGMDGRKSKL